MEYLDAQRLRDRFGPLAWSLARLCAAFPRSHHHRERLIGALLETDEGINGLERVCREMISAVKILEPSLFDGPKARIPKDEYEE